MLLTLLLVYLCPLVGVSNAQVRTMVAELRGGQEVPPVATSAFGSARFVIDTDAKTVTYHISFTGLSSAETAAHIHGPAGPGVNAGVKHNLATGNPKVGVWNYDPSDEEDLLAGRMYVNIHSASFPGGEIRGQINDFAMAMDGGQENPAVATSGKGWGTFNIDRCRKQLHYHIVVESLDHAETVAHIHGMALPGANAGILLHLPVGPVKAGTWDYPPAIEEDIMNGLTYVNVHSTTFPAGEIRGQIVSTVVPIDASQEVPPNASTAAGNGYVAYNTAANQLGYYFTFAGLTSAETAAHIHGFSPPGVNSGVVHNLPVGSPKKGMWTYGAANAANVMDGRIYINIHTTMFPGGEIRGQIEPGIPGAEPKLGDLNCDGVVNVSDLLILFSHWGAVILSHSGPSPDLNGDGVVNVSDLLILFANWG